MTLKLFSRPDCHLCDEALELLAITAPQQAVSEVDIEDDLGLLRQYGTRVPVLLREDTGAELGWPFDAALLVEFLA